MQGILAICKVLADKEPCTLPRRYINALENLAMDKNITVTQADKGGGVIIMDSSHYLQKLNELLSDAETYEKKTLGFAKKESISFNKQARKILRKSEAGKHFFHLLEESPKSPHLRGLPKIHKTGMPMRPIISGIGSAPHKLAKNSGQTTDESSRYLKWCPYKKHTRDDGSIKRHRYVEQEIG